MHRQLISSGSPWELTIGYSRAVRVGERVFVSGTAPQFDDGNCPDDAGLQARRCFEIIMGALAAAGGSAADVVRTRIYLIDSADFDAVGHEHGALFGNVRPANTTVVVKELLDPRWRCEIEVEAVIIAEHSPMG